LELASPRLHASPQTLQTVFTYWRVGHKRARQKNPSQPNKISWEKKNLSMSRRVIFFFATCYWQVGKNLGQLVGSYAINCILTIDELGSHHSTWSSASGGYSPPKEITRIVRKNCAGLCFPKIRQGHVVLLDRCFRGRKWNGLGQCFRS